MTRPSAARLVLTFLALSLGAGCYASHGRGADGRRDAGPPTPGRDAGPPVVGRDAGPLPRRDAGPSVCGDECASEVVRWRYDGGLVAFEVRFELSPCGRVLRVLDRFGAALPDTCVGDVRVVACDALVALNAALASEAVQQLRATAPILLGVDSRPSDGQVLELGVGGSAPILVGGDCPTRPDPSCVEVPPEVRELEDALREIQTALEGPEVCPDVRPAVTFPCGDGAERIECIGEREICRIGYSPISPECGPPVEAIDGCSPDPLACRCLLVSLAETCSEDLAGNVTLRRTGP